MPLGAQAAWLLLMLFLGACATRPVAVEGDLALARSAKVATNAASGAVLATPAEGAPVVHAVGRRHSILLLSGGGSDGAFGAGVLVGWTETGERPMFDIVTGVSTGALMATFAFLGPDHDPQLRHVYTALNDRDIYRSRGLAGLLKGSLKDQKPLEQVIATFVDDALIARVAAEHAKGRRLYVATTNLDTGLQVTWDMGRIASSSSPERAHLYRQVLAASAAIPGVFRPIYIRSLGETPSLHVDGGVHSAVLFHSFMMAAESRAQDVWAIVNGQIHYQRSDGPANPNVTALIERSVGEMLASIATTASIGPMSAPTAAARPSTSPISRMTYPKPIPSGSTPPKWSACSKPAARSPGRGDGQTNPRASNRSTGCQKPFAADRSSENQEAFHKCLMSGATKQGSNDRIGGALLPGSLIDCWCSQEAVIRSLG